MVSRIKQLLDWQQLSPTQFADRIGVGRPVVSHILSERNKPSLEVVQRIIAAFPELSLPWLLSGTGQMLANGAEQAAFTPPKPADALPTVVSTLAPEPKPIPSPRAATSETAKAPVPSPITEAERPVALPRPAIARFSLAKPVPASAPESSLIQPAAPVLAAPVAEQLVPAVAPSAASVPTIPSDPLAAAKPVEVADDAMLTSVAEPGKAIRRIVIFYRDGSFVDYQPEA